MAKQINIREELNKRDMQSCKTDFVNMYESANLSLDKKKELAKLLAENKSNKVISKFFESAEGNQIAQDYIDSKNDNFEKDKETTREVRKELAKQGIATKENGEPITEDAYKDNIQFKVTLKDSDGKTYTEIENVKAYIVQDEDEQGIKDLLQQYYEDEIIKIERVGFYSDDKDTNLFKYKESVDSEKEFTIHYNKNGFEYGSYGAVRVKASDEEGAKKKFLSKKTDKDIEITSIRPTENEDIRKGIRLLENNNKKDEFTVEINNEIYCDDFGNPYHFSSYEEAEEFIEENELENAIVTRQYGKAKYEEAFENKNSNLEQQIRNTIRNVFKDYDEEDYNDIIGDYLIVDIEPCKDGRTKVEVRAELGYSSMNKIANTLDPIVQKLDKDAYFDHDDSGIISAYISCDKLTKTFKENLKEEYGYYKDEPYCEEIANDLERGVWVGETSNGTSWELTINGYSSDEFSPSFADYLAEEVAYPVRDGHLAYLGIEMILYKSSMESIFGYDKLIPDLIKLDVDRESIDEWLSNSDPDAILDFHYDFNIAFDENEWEENNREDVDLPNDVTYDFYSLVDDDVDIESGDYNLDDVIADRLSDDYGYTHYGFEYDVDTESGDVYVYNIKWDVSESLKESHTNTNKQPLKPATFTIDDTHSFEGYDEEYDWNGWKCPWFTKEVGDTIIDYYKDYMHFNAEKDAFAYVSPDDDGEIEYFVGQDIETVDGVKHLYPIGNKSWIWDKYSEDEDLEEDYTHFTYKSGANPYIAKTDKEAQRILNKYKGKVKETKKGFYEINDTKEDSFITESVSIEDEIRERISNLPIGKELVINKANGILTNNKMHIKKIADNKYELFNTGFDGGEFVKSDYNSHSTLENAIHWALDKFVSFESTLKESANSDNLLSNEEFVKAYKEQGFEGAEIILDWDKKQHTFEEWEELLLNTYLDLEQDLLAQGDFETVKHNRDTYINKIIGDKVLSESRPTSKDYDGIEKAVNSAIYSKEGQLDKLLNKVIVEMENLYGPWEWQPGAPDTEEEYRRNIRDQFSQIEYVDEYISEWKGIKEGRTLVDLLTQIRDILDNNLPPKPNYLGDE